MILINKQIEKKLKEEYKNARFPSGINNIYNLSAQGEVGDKIEFFLSSKAVCENMQEDMAAFEAWSLILIRYKIAKTIMLKWEKPDDKNNLFYNRFLFRVDCFKKLFDWFNVDMSNCQDLVEFSKIYNDRLVVNEPRIKCDGHILVKDEAVLEKQIVENHSRKISKALGINIPELKRQLPVGLFKDFIGKNNRIFSGGKSAIDFYGIDSENKTIAIFELKCNYNKKVGILSELFFYTMFVINILEGKFVYDENITSKPGQRLIIDNIENIKSCFLTPEIHPLIDDEVVATINHAFNKFTSAGNRVKYVSFINLRYNVEKIDLSFDLT